MYDVIGDIHGNAVLLEKMLFELGYVEDNGIYSHPSRTAIFLGDLIDKGNEARKVLGIVRPMVENDKARCILGNHEYNMVAYHTQDEDGNYLREHTDGNYFQIKESLDVFQEYKDELDDHLEWFQTLPIFIEEDNIRIIHATWYTGGIELIRHKYSENCLTDELLYASAIDGSPEFKAIEFLLKGQEIQLPDGLSFEDNKGKERFDFRIKWWEVLLGKSYEYAAVRSDGILFPLNNVKRVRPDCSYAAEERPVFFGHYCLPEDPMLYKPNVCCLDYCIYNTNRLVAYRFDGEQELDEAKLVLVTA